MDQPPAPAAPEELAKNWGKNWGQEKLGSDPNFAPISEKSGSDPNFSDPDFLRPPIGCVAVLAAEIGV
jgi:hypothetical protein